MFFYLYVSDLVRRWCTLEGGFLSYYENEKNATPIGRVDVSDVVSLAISNTENITETGYMFPPPTLSLSLTPSC